MKDEWRPVAFYSGHYKVSNLGKVESVDRLVSARSSGVRLIKGCPITACPDADGYLTVNLWKFGVHVTKGVHRLVAEAFLPNPEGKPEVNHKDGNKANNQVSNLEWATHKENEDHARSTGLKDERGSKNGNARLTERDILVIRDRLSRGELQAVLAKDYGVRQPTISNIKNRKRWKHC